MTNKPTSAEAGTFFIAAIIIAHGAWSVMFYFGAFGEINNQHLIIIWVASLAALIASLIAGKTSDGENFFSWSGTCILLLPSLWFALEVFSAIQESSSESNIARWILSVCALVFSVPYISYIILQSALPEVAELHHPRLWFGLVFITIFIAILAYLVGSHNYYFMTCSDFPGRIPDNCYVSSKN